MNGQPKIEFTSEQLEEGFTHLDDIMNRCLIPVTLLNDTALTIKEGRLGGNQLDIGVRAADLTESSLSTLKTLAKGEDLNLGIKDFNVIISPEEKIKEITWNYKGIPVTIKVIHREYNFFKNPDYVWYWGETYNIPNPFDKYYKARHIIQ